MKKISRRSFLKVSGTMAAAGALAACGGSSSTSTAASSEAAPSVEAKAVDGLPDMSKETLNFSSDKVGSGSYNMIVAMSKVLEKAGGFQTVNVNPDSPGGMGAPYLFASGNTDLAFINGAPAKWAMEEGTLGKPATSGYAAIIGGLTAVCYINCVSNAFLPRACTRRTGRPWSSAAGSAAAASCPCASAAPQRAPWMLRVLTCCSSTSA